ncbi:CGNR zinc finger domain-containing protein [Glycomyces albidus]|nr:ABATE domain-containing protein [Glycomyces albidus]
MADDVPDLYPSEPRAVRLMNTVWADKDGVHDALATTAQLERWTAQCGLPDTGRAGAADLDRARTLRGALRRLAAAAVADDRRSAVDTALSVETALADLNALMATCTPELLHGDEGFRHHWRSTAQGFERTLVDLAFEGADLLTGTSELPLRACYGPGCVLYFVRNHPRREWCSSGCGNRARVARHYQRHKQSDRA